MRRPRRAPVLAHRLARLGWLALALGLLWAGGLVWFAGLIPEAVEDSGTATDAIVVLTGGSGRLKSGLDLLAAGRAKKLFVSGVYRGIEVEQLLVLASRSPANLDCCVVLGYAADNTEGNAIESAAWMGEQGYTSLRLVTAGYHMPRSLLEFRHAMPGIEIVAHPVFPSHVKQADWWRWPGSARLIVGEYHKYLAAWLRQLIAPGASAIAGG